MSPKISIITVCFNSQETIQQTIESVLGQKEVDVEYLILDGNSTDGTVEIINKYKDQLGYFQSQKDKGMYDAINQGIEKAQGEIIGILNADDFYSNNEVLSKVVAKMEDEKTDSLYADLHYVDFYTTSKVIRSWQSGIYKEGKFLYGWMPPHPTFFVRRSVYKSFGCFNLNLISAADYELMLRFLHKYKVAVSYLPEVIVKMRVGGMSNASIKNRFRANREDKRAWDINGLKPLMFTFFLKPMRKVVQYIRK